MASDQTSHELVELARRLIHAGNTVAAFEAARRRVLEAPADLDALETLAEISERSGGFAEAESAYRRALEIEPQSRPYRLALARLLSKRVGRHTEAIELCHLLLADQQTDVQALELLLDALRLVGEPDVFGEHIATARRLAPANVHIQLLESQWLIAIGKQDEALGGIRSIVTAKTNSPAAWLALLRETESTGAFDEAIELSARAVDACPNVGWMWRRRVMMLSAAGREEELASELSSRPPPDVSKDPKEFWNWGVVMRRIEAPSLLADATADTNVAETLASTQEGAQLLADLGKDVGEPHQVITYLQRAITFGATPWLARQLFDAAVWAGDLDLAEQAVITARKLRPNDLGGVQTFVLDECRIFKDSMGGISAAMRLSRDERLRELSENLLRYPQSLPAALAWMFQYRADRMPSRPTSAVTGSVPPIIWHSQRPSPEWVEKNASFRWRDVLHESTSRELLGGLGVRQRAMFRRYNAIAKADILKLLALQRSGGWWASPTGRVDAAVSGLAMDDKAATLTLDDRYRPSPALLGASVNARAIEVSLGVASTALDEAVPYSEASLTITGLPALALGFATEGARQIVKGGNCDLALLTSQATTRLLGRSWPD